MGFIGSSMVTYLLMYLPTSLCYLLTCLPRYLRYVVLMLCSPTYLPYFTGVRLNYVCFYVLAYLS
ncbi:hypothetical protein F5X96DRAFT_621181 [Biscogniauxia mediterranea]|nr:hypothetical protein F5X96DRAFT_621181 [Biscogniauxia mediterranea]